MLFYRILEEKIDDFDTASKNDVVDDSTKSSSSRWTFNLAASAIAFRG